MTTETRITSFSRGAVEELSRMKDEPHWMRDRRLESWRVYEDTPMPTRSDEAWRRTDIRRLKPDKIAPYTPAGPSAVVAPLGLDAAQLAGVISQTNSAGLEARLSPEARDQGVIFTGMDEAVREHSDLVETYFMNQAVEPVANKFAALHGAFWSGGAFVYVPAGVVVDLPLRSLVGLTGPGAALFSHTIVVLEPGARLTYIEEYASEGLDEAAPAALSAGVVEVFVQQEAQLTLVTLQEFLGDVFDINTQRALLARDSRLDWLMVGMGAGTTKANIEVALRGPGASTQMLGMLWGHGQQHTDYHTLQDHQAPNCSSDLLYKAALTDEAVSVFSGRIRVAKGAHRTDSYQANRTVILSDEAAAFPSPNLEIEANDVRCTHGASVGKVDAEQLFYLMSRGLSHEVATKMIVEGFFEEVLLREPAAAIRENLRELIRRKMESRY